MEKWRGKVAIVTGASSGIGAATARALASRGLIVVALARREERLQELADEFSKMEVSGNIYPRKVDLSKDEDILETFSWVDKELGGADILVNNAGLVYTGLISEGKMEEWREMFDVNVLAVTLCTKLFLNSMEQRKNQNGHIFIINSVAGHLAEFPGAAMYCGSKHAIRAISMCLRRELAEKGSTIKVTSVSPGPVATEIFKNTYLEGIETKMAMLESADVAAAIVDALSASPVTEICEIVLNPVPTKHALY